MKKRILCIIIAAILILPATHMAESRSLTSAETPVASSDIKVFVNGQRLSLDQSPIIENDRTLVPLRAIFEALGAEVDWEPSSQTVTAKKNDITITLKIGKAVLTYYHCMKVYSYVFSVTARCRSPPFFLSIFACF